MDPAKGSMCSTASFDTFCGPAAKLPNLCASDLSPSPLLLLLHSKRGVYFSC